MKLEKRRLFISDLPEEISQEDLTEVFGQFGTVGSVEIKQRKEISTKHQYSHFAFVNLDADNLSLQKCIESFAHDEWKGYYLNVQLAKESFLDRLKREREEANQSKNKPSETLEKPKIKQSEALEKIETNYFIPFSNSQIKNGDLTSEIESLSDEEDKVKIAAKHSKSNKSNNKVAKEKSSSEESSSDDDANERMNKVINIKEREDDLKKLYSDIVVKNNKNKTFNNKIESVGYEPIIKIDLSKKKPKSKDPKRTEADQKRLNSMLAMKQGYQQQKNAIKNALARIDVQNNHEIVKENNVREHEEKNQQLFDDDDEEIHVNGDFAEKFKVKKQFEGVKGQKLLELQSRFKNDTRFQMDERFHEHNDEEGANEVDGFEEQEKIKQYEILEQVLGKKIHTDSSSKNKNKTMLRFDPNQPEHSKYEVKEDLSNKEKKKRKRKDSEANKEEEAIPEVSKEVFYKVADDFKSTLEEKQAFSFLSAFGRKDGNDEDEDEDAEVEIDGEHEKPAKKSKKALDTQNPFRYDSSDDDDESPNNAEITQKTDDEKERSNVVNLGPSKLWSEPFFFKNDDFRLQDGVDFIKRIQGEETTEFFKIRRNIKEITKAKARHNQRKTRPFKKKLGGSKKKRINRVQKALKR